MSSSSTYYSALIISACILALSLIGCGGSGEEATDAAPATPEPTIPTISNFDGASLTGDALERVREAGVLVLAYANEAPYGHLDTASGRVTGEAPELARVVAQALGIERVEMQMVEWGSLIPGLQSGRFDVIGAGMYITPARAENVAFTNPTYRIGEAFLVAAGNPKGLHSYDDVATNDNATIGVVSGTVERDYARNAGIPDERVVVFNDNDSALAGVRSGQVDVFAGTALTVQTLVDRVGAEAGVERADPFTQPTNEDGSPVYGYGAFAFRPADADLRDAFNAALAAFLGTPEHRAMVAPFGFGDNEMTNGLTADEVLAEQ